MVLLQGAHVVSELCVVLMVETIEMSLDTSLQSLWYDDSRLAWLLLPLSWLFSGVSAIRRGMYHAGLFATVKVSKPVIVVGNITAGGTGKTPLVVWLAQTLKSGGYKVAVIARGYRGHAASWPQVVTKDSDPEVVGDEPVVIAQQVDAIVVAGPDRVINAERAIELGAEVIISDDGLQHYHLHRDCEIAVVDGSRLFGNGFRLPAGPLRESPRRLQTVDLVLINQRDVPAGNQDVHFSVLNGNASYRVKLTRLRSIKSDSSREIESFRGQQVHVVTGIGNPKAFVKALQERGIKVVPHILPDHAKFTQQDICFGDELPVFMTAKDAVKCRRLEIDGRYWVVDAQAVLDDDVANSVIDRIHTIIDHSR